MPAKVAYVTLDWPGCWYGVMSLRFVRQMIAATLPDAHVEITDLQFVKEETDGKSNG